MTRKVVLYVLLTLSQVTTYGQEMGPTLTVGLDKLVFGKGLIDTDLLGEIITRKKDELKAETIKREISERLRMRNYATYTYADNILDLLLKDKNRQVISRELLEYTANYAVTLGISEFYLEVSHKSQSEVLKQFLKDFYLDSNEENSAVVMMSQGALSMPLLRKAKVRIGKYKLGYSLNDVLIDLVYDIFSKKYEIQKLGFFVQASNNTVFTYESHNSYLRYQKSLDSLAKSDANAIQHPKASLDSLRKNIEELINPFFTSFELLEETDFLRGTGLKEVIANYRAMIKEKSKITDDKTRLLENVNERLRNVKADIERRKSRLKKMEEWTSLRKEKLLKDLAGAENASKDPLKEKAREFTSRLNEAKIMPIEERYPDLMETLDSFVQDISGISEETMKLDESGKFKGIKLSVENTKREVSMRLVGIDQIAAEMGDLTASQTALNEIILRIKDNSKDEAISTLDYNKYLFSASIRSVKSVLMNDMSARTDSVVARTVRTMIDLENPSGKYKTLAYSNFILRDLIPYLSQANLSADVNNQIKLSASEQADPTKRAYSTKELLISNLELIAYLIKWDQLGNLEKYFKGVGNLDYVNPKNFIDFVSQLNHLDKASTYDYLLKIVVDAGNIFADERTANVVNSLVNNVKKFVILSDGGSNRTISVDIESLLDLLIKKYGERYKNRFGLYLSIGANNAFQIKQALLLDDSTTVNNLSFASEKIGIKYKILNWRYRYALAERNRTPIVSDLYANAYASGLLYNLTNLKTKRNFNFPLLGAGIGFAFYNYVDLNIGLCTPIMSKADAATMWNNRFLSIGFDIKFSEYFSELSKKRKSAKEKEKVSGK